MAPAPQQRTVTSGRLHRLHRLLGWWSRRRLWGTVGLLVVFVIAMSYRGWSPSDETWRRGLRYPNRGAARGLDRGALTPAAVCGGCHQTHYAEWKTSAMARSTGLSEFLVQLYATSLELRGAPPEDVEICMQCHAPAALFGATPDLALADPLSLEGVTCDICHTATSARADASPGDLSWDPSGPKRGPLPGSMPAADPGGLQQGATPARSLHHETIYSPLHESSELCGACHMSAWPTNGLPIDWTYAEWARSPYAARGVQCQDCHMPTYAGQAAPGAPLRSTLHRHDFRGGGDVTLVRQAARLQISVSSSAGGYEVIVEVENVGAGHAFPTGNATAPEVVLELVAYREGVEGDLAGASVLAQRREYKLVYEDSSGAVTNDPTVAAKVRSDTTLQPLEPRQEHFVVPSELGAARVEARLIYRRWGSHLDDHQQLAREFLGRYLAEGVRLHALLGNLDKLDSSVLADVRGHAPIVVDKVSAILSVPVFP